MTYDENAVTNALDIYTTPRYFALFFFFLFPFFVTKLSFNYDLWIIIWFIFIFYFSCSGAVHFMASNNDCGVREFDMERFQMTKHFRFPWSINVLFRSLSNTFLRKHWWPFFISYKMFALCMQHTSISPDGKLLIVVGDNPEGMLVDSNSGKVICYLPIKIWYIFGALYRKVTNVGPDNHLF